MLDVLTSDEFNRLEKTGRVFDLEEHTLNLSEFISALYGIAKLRADDNSIGIRVSAGFRALFIEGMIEHFRRMRWPVLNCITREPNIDRFLVPVGDPLLELIVTSFDWEIGKPFPIDVNKCHAILAVHGNNADTPKSIVLVNVGNRVPESYADSYNDCFIE